MKCPQCLENLDLTCDFNEDKIGWNVYECKRCEIEVIKYNNIRE